MIILKIFHLTGLIMPLPYGLDRDNRNYCYFSAAIQLIVEIPEVQKQLEEYDNDHDQQELCGAIARNLAELKETYPDSSFVKKYEGLFKNRDHIDISSFNVKPTAESKSGLHHDKLKSDEKISKNKFLIWIDYIKSFLKKIINFIKNLFFKIKELLTKFTTPIEALYNQSEAERYDTKKVIQEIKKYYLIQFLRKLHQANKEHQPIFLEEWAKLKDLILDQDYCDGFSSVQMSQLRLQQILDLLKIEKNIFYGTSALLKKDDQEDLYIFNEGRLRRDEDDPSLTILPEHKVLIYSPGAPPAKYSIKPPIIFNTNDTNSYNQEDGKKFYLHSISLHQGAHYSSCRAYYNQETHELEWLHINDTSVQKIESFQNLRMKPYNFIYVAADDLSELQIKGYERFNQQNHLEFTNIRKR